VIGFCIAWSRTELGALQVDVWMNSIHDLSFVDDTQVLEKLAEQVRCT